MQNQRLHYSTEINILKGHEKVVWDMQDVIYKLEDWVTSFTTWLYTVAEDHIENNTVELNWDVAQVWQLPGMPSSTSLRMDSWSLDFSEREDYNSLEE